MTKQTAAALLTLALLSGCGAAPQSFGAPVGVSTRMAAADFSHAEQSYSYRLSSKAAKKFMDGADAIVARHKASGTTCKLSVKGGLFGSTVQVELKGSLEDVSAAREELDALYKSVK